MDLRNRDIAEGMRVTNGKDIWRVIHWDDKYQYALLQRIDRRNKEMKDYVIAENFELYGDSANPQITWMNGKYFRTNSVDDAIDIFIGWFFGDRLSESRKNTRVRRKSLKESTKPELYDACIYKLTDAQIYDDNFYGRRMIYPKKNQEISFDELSELIDSIKKNGYLVFMGQHTDELHITLQIFADRGRDVLDMIGLFEDIVAEYDMQMDISNEALLEIKKMISYICE